jgi:predicted transcriptional regulator
VKRRTLILSLSFRCNANLVAALDMLAGKMVQHRSQIIRTALMTLIESEKVSA